MYLNTILKKTKLMKNTLGVKPFIRAPFLWLTIYARHKGIKNPICAPENTPIYPICKTKPLLCQPYPYNVYLCRLIHYPHKASCKPA